MLLQGALPSNYLRFRSGRLEQLWVGQEVPYDRLPQLGDPAWPYMNDVEWREVTDVTNW